MGRMISIRTLGWLTLMTSLAGCGASVPVMSEFPTPLVRPVDARVGILLDDALTSYEHEENLAQHSRWSIQLGDANSALFGPLIESMFTETTVISELPATADLDAVMRPQLDKFEFDVPVGSDAKFVEVWLQYTMHLTGPDGTVISEWPVTGYGKSKVGRLRNNESLRKAAVRAMREVGAQIVTKFSSQPGIEAWLEALAPPPEPEESEVADTVADI